jgi:hypothetical protein
MTHEGKKKNPLLAILSVQLLEPMRSIATCGKSFNSFKTEIAISRRIALAWLTSVNPRIRLAYVLGKLRNLLPHLDQQKCGLPLN